MDGSISKVPSILLDQVKEILYRAEVSVVDEGLREAILDVADGAIREAGLTDDLMIDGDSIINFNEEDGYWITCRLYVSASALEEDDGSNGNDKEE